ncbi:MAG TPA: hypothetical protein ENH40_02145 [Nitrospirae bacterium]|nr:hypothetical protein [Nitrospirota bacterium]
MSAKDKKLYTLFCIISLLIFICTADLYADTDKWTGLNNGLEKGTIRSLAIDPYDTDIIYAGDSQGTYTRVLTAA